MVGIRRKHELVLGLLAAGMLTCLTGVWGAGNTDTSSKNDSGDRSLAFVEKSVEATNLFNERKMAEALTAFQDLMQNYGDLDQDGYVAMSLADCLYVLGRNDEARKVYEAAALGHPQVAATAQYRIREIDISQAEATDALIARSRQAVATASKEQRSGAQLQLGRVLQKRASALLKEAVDMFRTAAESDKDLVGQRAIANQAMLLAEIQEDLASLIDRIEKTWGALRTLDDIARDGLPDASRAVGVTDFHAEWTVRGEDGNAIRIDTQWAQEGDQVKLMVNGRPVDLNSSELQIIRRHLERVSATVQDHLAPQASSPSNPSVK
jgi:tetratricopeptide (TPR) repeat protein